jgi:hypothetical protein
MKTTQNLLVCALLTCILAIPTAAGDMHNPGRMTAPPTVPAGHSYPKTRDNPPRKGGNSLDLLIQVALFFHKNISTAL